MESNLSYKLDESVREEIIGGRVVAMASPVLEHKIIGSNVHHIFRTYLHGKKCKSFPDGTALFLEDDKEEYQPDMMVVCDRNKFGRKGIYGAPDLVVEILSPSTAKNDKGHKKDVYEKHGVREYWIVNPKDQSVEQYALENGRFVLRDVYTRYSEEMLEDLKEAERAEVVTEFKCTLFDDLTIRLDDVFSMEM